MLDDFLLPCDLEEELDEVVLADRLRDKRELLEFVIRECRPKKVAEK